MLDKIFHLIFQAENIQKNVLLISWSVIWFKVGLEIMIYLTV